MPRVSAFTTTRSARNPGSNRPRSDIRMISAGREETSAQACGRLITPRSTNDQTASGSAGI
ncbi:MAG: hypothetical protein ACD_54C01176G0001 [uncultured bacterium]|nr:MAG: hypothetical protein ACD_54C01176G0001 [uncultured bacterium]